MAVPGSSGFSTPACPVCQSTFTGASAACESVMVNWTWPPSVASAAATDADNAPSSRMVMVTSEAFLVRLRSSEVALPRVTVTVSSGSSTLSVSVEIVIVPESLPAGMVRAPLGAV